MEENEKFLMASLASNANTREKSVREGVCEEVRKWVALIFERILLCMSVWVCVCVSAKLSTKENSKHFCLICTRKFHIVSLFFSPSTCCLWMRIFASCVHIRITVSSSAFPLSFLLHFPKKIFLFLKMQSNLFFYFCIWNGRIF